MSIDVTDLSVSYGQTVALREVSLSSTHGVLALLGPNGSGKTTFLSVLTGGRRRFSGAVKVLGVPAAELRRSRVAAGRIGYLPQAFDLAGHLSVLDTVRYAAWCNGVKKSAALSASLDALSVVGLSKERGKRVAQLSGGMRQRVGLASAIVHRPALLILDEPTVGLDPDQRVDFREFVRAAARSSHVILATHLLEDVAHCAERVAILASGQLVFDGSTAELSQLGARSGSGAESELEAGYRHVTARQQDDQ